MLFATPSPLVPYTWTYQMNDQGHWVAGSTDGLPEGLARGTWQSLCFLSSPILKPWFDPVRMKIFDRLEMKNNQPFPRLPHLPPQKVLHMNRKMQEGVPRKLGLMVPLAGSCPDSAPRDPFLGMRIQLDLKTARIALCCACLGVHLGCTVVGTGSAPGWVTSTYRGSGLGADPSSHSDPTCSLLGQDNTAWSTACRRFQLVHHMFAARDGITLRG